MPHSRGIGAVPNVRFTPQSSHSTQVSPMSALRQKRSFEKWIFCSAKAAVLAPPSVNRLGSGWDFFPLYGRFARESSHCCQPQPPMPQCRNTAGLGASMAEESEGQGPAQRRQALALILPLSLWR